MAGARRLESRLADRQDLLITRAMVAIFSDPFLSEHVAMRGPARMTVEVEVNFSEREPFYRIVDLPYHPPLTELHTPVRLRSYDLDEMLGTKMRALLQRTQGRDLYDLDLALSRPAADGVLPDPDRVVAAFRYYMSRENTHARLL